MSLDLPLSTVIELILAVLLAATFVCCFSVDRRLRRLRSDQATLSSTVRTLNDAIVNASASIAKLRAAAADADRTLGSKVTSGRALVDELSLLTAACERLVTRMEQARDVSAPARLRAVR
jgi:hypothetical protein